MARFPCLPLWTDAWLADTGHLTRAERGTYLDLLILMWRTPGCRVPNDNAWLAKHLGLSLDEVEGELRSIIKEFCQNDGNHITQKRLKREFHKQFEFAKVQSVRSKSRWNKDNDLSPRGESQPTLPLTPKKESSLSRIDPAFVLPAQRQDHYPARSHRYGAPDGALAREPGAEQADEKSPADLTLAEINRKVGWG